MPKLTKRESSARYVGQFQSIFACPVCSSHMKMSGLSLVCSNNHTFDFTKQGYVNLLTHPPKEKYSKDLFEARKAIIAEKGLFQPLTDVIAEWLANQTAWRNTPAMILDTGCGEGSHLLNICEQFRTDGNKSVAGAGIDIAKEGIFTAAKNYPDMIWAVADLANSPFKDAQFDMILNILSPSNYTEFARLLKSGGCLIKVVPQSGYLKELRETFFKETGKESYSNTDTVARFREYFHMLDHIRVHYTKRLGQSSISSLLKMTPLTWNIPEEEIRIFAENHPEEVTIDLDILIGK